MKVFLRLAAESDAAMVFAWRNHEAVRKVSHDPREITWEDHLIWFKRAIQQEERRILIAQDAELPVGVLRFDISQNIAEVSIYTDPCLIGKGYGSAMLAEGVDWVKKHLKHVNKLRATVRPDNPASVQLFERAGFGELFKTYELALRNE